MGSIGFKEWALVCEALGRGEQTVILRKGGIAEGRDGFAFRHREFFLFPTFFHGQVERVRTPGAVVPVQKEGEIEIRYFASVEASELVTQWEKAAALEAFHVLDSSVVRERFEYDSTAGIHVAFVRVYRLSAPWQFENARRFGGCRSWVDLTELPQELRLESVLDDAEHARRAAQFRAVITGPSS